MPEHLLLVGMMGSGKSTVGRLVADRLGRPFTDSDEQVEALTGRTVADYANWTTHPNNPSVATAAE